MFLRKSNTEFFMNTNRKRNFVNGLFKVIFLITFLLCTTEHSSAKKFVEYENVKVKNGKLSMDLILKIEASLLLPERAYPLTSYVRYYAQQKNGQNNYIIGAFVRKNGEEGGIKIVNYKDLPIIFDGGCSIIDMVYSVNKRKVVSLMCHGEA